MGENALTERQNKVLRWTTAVFIKHTWRLLRLKGHKAKPWAVLLTKMQTHTLWTLPRDYWYGTSLTNMRYRNWGEDEPTPYRSRGIPGAWDCKCPLSLSRAQTKMLISAIHFRHVFESKFTTHVSFKFLIIALNAINKTLDVSKDSKGR